MKAFNQEKALVGAFSVITNLRMELFEALVHTAALHPAPSPPGEEPRKVAQDDLQQATGSSLAQEAAPASHNSHTAR